MGRIAERVLVAETTPILSGLLFNSQDWPMPAVGFGQQRGKPFVNFQLRDNGCICFCVVVRNSGCSPERRKPSTSRSARYLAIPRFFAFCLHPLVFKVQGIMKEAQNVDELLDQQGWKRKELEEIEAKLKESRRFTAIVFVDLCGSTELKENETDQVWLGFIYRFIEMVNQQIRTAGGMLVKRTGDGLIAVFDTVTSAETFLDLLETNLVLGSYD